MFSNFIVLFFMRVGSMWRKFLFIYAVSVMGVGGVGDG